MSLKCLVSLILVLAFVALPVEALAQDTPATDAERLREIEDQRRENARQAAELRERAAAAARALETLKNRLVDTANSLQEAETRTTELERRLSALQAEERSAAAALKLKQADISQVLAALMALERSRPPALAVSPDDANKAAIAAIALAAVTPELQGQVEGLQVELDDIEKLRGQITVERVALEEAETALSERRRLLEELLLEREQAQQRDTVRLRELETEDSRLAAEATTLRELISGVAALNRGETVRREDAARNIPVPVTDLPQLFSRARQLLPLPASGRIVQRFGDETSDGVRADGITLSTRASAVVTSPFPGTVDWAEPFGRFGNVVIVDVGEKYRMVLIGIGRLDVRSGDTIRAGEPVGVMAQTGPGLLRFQLRRNDLPIDPVPWFQPDNFAAAGG